MKIYFVGIGGVGMGNLAVVLKSLGHEVTGSDANVFPPMSHVLHDSDIHYNLGFSESSLPEDFDLFIIGNSISKSNEQAKTILENEWPHVSMAQAIQDFLLKGKESIVIAGTHGKTTTTAMMAHVLSECGQEPGFFIGGICENLRSGANPGEGRYFVIEGDEYDSAFFEKRPKFLSYQPKHLILNALEFDHGDIYDDLAAIEKEISNLIDLVPVDGTVVVNDSYSNLKKILQEKGRDYIGFGDVNSLAQIQSVVANADHGHTDFEVAFSGDIQKLKLPLFGQHNVWNATACYLLAVSLKLDPTRVADALANFAGV